MSSKIINQTMDAQMLRMMNKTHRNNGTGPALKEKNLKKDVYNRTIL